MSRIGPALLVLILALAACGGQDVPEPTGLQARADEAMAALCRIAAGELEGDRVAEAFHGRVHDALHEVAAEARAVDPAAAGALLEAKAVVEADLELTEPPADLLAHARTLADAFAAAVRAMGLDPLACTG
jgi:hypothetical protein